MRFRHEWHIRWVQGSLADFDIGMSSEPQVKHGTSFSGIGEGLVKSEPRRDDVRCGALALVLLSPSALGLGTKSLMEVSVVLFLIWGRNVVVVDDLRTMAAGSVLRR